MIVEARRDDGALMVTDGLGAAIVLPTGLVTYLPKDSVYARGGWTQTIGGTVPGGVNPEQLRQARERAEGAAVPLDSDGGPKVRPATRSADGEDDGLLDEDSLALLTALNELSGEAPMFDGEQSTAGGTRDWSPAQEKLHPRGPGGKFRTTVDRIKDAIAKHVDGDGKGDPLKEFNREQLRKVAKARGIELKRGEHEDSIKKKLIDHLTDGVDKAKADKPATKSTKAPSASQADFEYPSEMSAEDVKARVPAQFAIDDDAEKGILTGVPGLTAKQRRAGEQALYDYMGEEGEASPWRIREPGPNKARDAIDAVMGESATTEPIVVWRGLQHPEALFGDRLSGNMTGQTVHDPNFQSTSPRREVAEFYAHDDGVVTRLEVPAGAHAVDLGFDDDEILLDRDSDLAVLADTGPGTHPRVVALGVRQRTKPAIQAKKPPGSTTAAKKVASTEVPAAKKAVPPDKPKADDFDARAGNAASGLDAVDSVPMALSTSHHGAAVDGPGTDSWTPAQHRATAEALESYQGGGYLDVNGGLRRGRLSPAAAADVEGIDRAMAASKLTRPVVVHRGGGRRGMFLPTGWQDNPDLTGVEWTDEAFSSTSPDEGSIEPFSQAIAMRVLVPEGTGAVYLPPPGIGGSAMVNEDGEILLDRKLTHRVVADHGVEPGTTTRHLDVEVVPKTVDVAAPKKATPFKATKKAIPPAPKPKTPDPKPPTVDTKAPSVYTGPSYKPPTRKTAKDFDEYKALLRRDMESRPGRAGKPLSPDEAIHLFDRRNELLDSLPVAHERRARQEAAIELEQEEFRTALAPGASSAAFREDLARRAKEQFAGKRVGVRVTAGGLSRLLDDGRFKTQFETGSSLGENDPVKRAAFEEQWFGLSRKADPKIRPVYGYLMSDGDVRPGNADDDALSQYGNIQVVLKDGVRSRTTAMFGDSMDGSRFGLPTPVDDPSWMSFSVPGDAIQTRALHRLDRDMGSDLFRSTTYAEATVHGGVSLDDIQEVLLPAQPSAALRRQLDAAGISWRVVGGAA